MCTSKFKCTLLLLFQTRLFFDKFMNVIINNIMQIDTTLVINPTTTLLYLFMSYKTFFSVKSK